MPCWCLLCFVMPRHVTWCYDSCQALFCYVMFCYACMHGRLAAWLDGWWMFMCGSVGRSVCRQGRWVASRRAGRRAGRQVSVYLCKHVGIQMCRCAGVPPCAYACVVSMCVCRAVYYARVCWSYRRCKSLLICLCIVVDEERCTVKLPESRVFLARSLPTASLSSAETQGRRWSGWGGRVLGV